MSGNGQLTPSELALIPANDDISTAGKQYVAIEVLPYLLAAAAEFRQRTGQKVYVAEGYRTLETQVAYFLDRYFVGKTGIFWRGQRWLKKAGKAAAAVPGTSIHGDGKAIDIWSGIDTSFTSTNHRIWVEVATRYGWKNTGTAFGEPWHQEWSRARVTRLVAALVNVTNPPTGPAGAALVITPTSPEHQEQEEPMTVLVTSPQGQSLVVPGIGHVAMSPSDVATIKGLGGPQIQTISVSAALHNRIQLASALRNDGRVLFLVRGDNGGGYALLEDRQFTIVGSMDTVNALTRAGVATVTINGAEFAAIIRDFGASRSVVVANAKDLR
ncbi:D-alanyl-D-alanine carboxypeptidase family protein [Curtobacterium sp. Csp2]|uniref:M15 family metallopeptidase n=1 Tax=Curtobacterium sp. Csp2 TaxID=2495430 RepID=UPI001580A48B|nr:M15 family metallopeptidase [Curtobacterium sp. Csp2]QKS17324.1 D-alanyl-D-alanine carboxypeptidase family protein [Curtobacterium sp. Csp2]